MPARERGSLTKEPPLSTLDATIALIRPGMRYDELLSLARQHTHSAAPGLLKSRFLVVDRGGQVVYDRFLSLVRANGIGAPLVRKVMYFTWAWRDERLRRFVCEQVAGSDGIWNVHRLIDKSRSAFFEEWLQPSSAIKARSNIEFFFTEAGIFDTAKKQVNLQLQDGWLAEAMLVAAQHEPDRSLRRLMIADPVATLERLGLLPLANISVSDQLDSPIEPITDFAQLEVDPVEARRYPVPKGRTWKVREPRSLARGSTETIIDLVAIERANASHLLLEKITAAALSGAGKHVECSESVDMYCQADGGYILFEMKSCHQGNLHSQVRRGLSQLLEYRYVYRTQFEKVAAMILVIEMQPPPEKQWLSDFLEYFGVLLAWPDLSNNLVTFASPPEALAGIVHHCDGY